MTTLPGTLEQVVIVGASLAGLRAAETLRSAGYGGLVTVIGSESSMPYDRPPLSKKYLGGHWDEERIALRKPDEFAKIDVEWRLGHAAAGLDTANNAVRLADGSEVSYDGLIIATGATPRRLPHQDEHPHALVLRTIDESNTLRQRLDGGGKRLVVIGAGFIGLEAAATARELGNEVLVLEAGPAPMIRGLGAEIGHAAALVHEDHGVEIRCSTAVDRLVPGGVALADGTTESADAVLVGIGVVPATEWLVDSGLQLDDGVVCAADLNVGVPRVYAAGDLVRWPNAVMGGEMRIEHWTNAAEQGEAAANNLLAEAAGEPTTPYSAVPFFWSEQYDRRIQSIGRADVESVATIVGGSVEERKFAAVYATGDRFRAVVGVNMPRLVMPMRQLLLDGASIDEAVAKAAELQQPKA